MKRSRSRRLAVPDLSSLICPKTLPLASFALLCLTRPPRLAPPLGLPTNPMQSGTQSPTDLLMIKQAADMINKAERPLIYAGNGVLSSPLGPKLLTQLAKEGNIPVTTTLQGLGAFDELDDLSLHMLGMHGSAYANLAMQQADVIIALGARFDDRVTGKVDSFAPAAKAAAAQGRGGIIHFEIQPKNINKIVDAQIPVLGDVIANMASLAPLLRPSPRLRWFSDIKQWKEKFPFTFEKSAKGEPSKPQEVIEELDRQTAHRKNDVIITTGVGQHQMWAAQHYRWRHPRTMVTSGGLGVRVTLQLLGVMAPDGVYVHRLGKADKVGIDHACVSVSAIVEQICTM